MTIEELLKKDEKIGEAFIRIYARFHRLAEIYHTHGDDPCDCPPLHDLKVVFLGSSGTSEMHPDEITMSCDKCGGVVPDCAVHLLGDLVVCERCWLFGVVTDL